MSNIKSFSYSLLALSAVLSFSTLVHAQEKSVELSKENPIKLGVVLATTGERATFGLHGVRGAQMAMDEINNAGGLLGGRKLELLIEDDQSRAGQPGVSAKKLISNDHIVGLIGESASGGALETGPVCQTAHIPMISPGGTNPAVTQKGDYVFRNCFIDPFQGTVMAKFALDHLMLKRVAMLVAVNQDYSIGLAEDFKKYFESHGGKVVAVRDYNSGDRDFRAQLTTLKAQNPEAIFVPGYYIDGALVARQARALNIQIPLLGGDGWDSPQYLQVGGSSVNGNYFSTHFSPYDQSPKVQNFVKKYQARFHEFPDATAALGYDAVYMFADAITHAGNTDPKAIRDVLASLKDYPAVSGTMTMDANRNPSKSAVILKVVDQKFVYDSTIAP